MTDDEIIALARETYERANEAERESRYEGLDDLRFARLGEQWPEVIRRQRELDGRPCLTINRLPAFIRQVVNDARQNKPAIEVHPADDGADPETAEVINGLIRNIQVVSDADVATDTAIESAVSNGFGYFGIGISEATEDTFDRDIVFERIANPFQVFGDPDSRSADSSDWNRCLVVEQMGKEEFRRRYKKGENQNWDTLGYVGLPAPWHNDDSIMVASFWFREEVERQVQAVLFVPELRQQIVSVDAIPDGAIPIGEPQAVRGHKVTQYVLSGAEVLEKVDWPGKYIPIVPVYGDEINVEGRRYFRSLINQAKDVQRNFNYWRSATTELVALAPKAPFIGPKGAFDSDAAKWDTANQLNHSYIEYDGPLAPQRQPFAGVPAGALQEALNASDDLKAVIGIYDASLGARSNETSGAAIRERKLEGDISTFHFLDNLSRAIRHAGRIIIDLIPKVYSTERIVRVLGADMKPRNVKIAPGAGPQSQTGMESDEDQSEPIQRIYDLSAGKYDLIVKAGPNYTSQREQTRAELVDIMRSFPDAAPILGPMYLRASDWPGADEAAEKLEQVAQGITGGGDGQAQAEQVKQYEDALSQAQKAIADLQQKLAEATDQRAQIDAALKARELEIRHVEASAKATSAQADMLRAQSERETAFVAATNPFAEVA